MTEPVSPQPIRDGRHDFDFLHGRWDVQNRKLKDPFDDKSGWLEFRARVETKPILHGLGNVDAYSAPDFPGRPQFEALALRLYDIENGVWRIWWASTAGGGQLDTPVVGRFRDGRGAFECDDTLAGRAIAFVFGRLHRGERKQCRVVSTGRPVGRSILRFPASRPPGPISLRFPRGGMQRLASACSRETEDVRVDELVADARVPSLFLPRKGDH